jgi:hypothetical protein
MIFQRCLGCRWVLIYQLVAGCPIRFSRAYLARKKNQVDFWTNCGYPDGKQNSCQSDCKHFEPFDPFKKEPDVFVGGYNSEE